MIDTKALKAKKPYATIKAFFETQGWLFDITEADYAAVVGQAYANPGTMTQVEHATLGPCMAVYCDFADVGDKFRVFHTDRQLMKCWAAEYEVVGKAEMAAVLHGDVHEGTDIETDGMLVKLVK